MGQISAAPGPLLRADPDGSDAVQLLDQPVRGGGHPVYVEADPGQLPDVRWKLDPGLAEEYDGIPKSSEAAPI